MARGLTIRAAPLAAIAAFVEPGAEYDDASPQVTDDQVPRSCSLVNKAGGAAKGLAAGRFCWVTSSLGKRWEWQWEHPQLAAARPVSH